jgi:hypothetical protein
LEKDRNVRNKKGIHQNLKLFLKHIFLYPEYPRAINIIGESASRFSVSPPPEHLWVRRTYEVAA